MAFFQSNQLKERVSELELLLKNSQLELENTKIRANQNLQSTTRQYEHKLNNLNLEIQKRDAEINNLKAMMTPEMQNANRLKECIKTLENHILSLNKEFIDKNNQVTSLDQQEGKMLLELENLRKQVLVQNELIELETFALYTPRFSFASAELYKNRLDTIRQEQKMLIKRNEAAVGAQSWTVNNDLKQGQKMVDDMKKLCLRSFNNECDTVISSVKFNNIDRCRDRIKRCHAAIGKLGQIMQVQISYRYLSLKLDELSLAFEYATQKQKEKEELRELRAQEKEAARAQKELEDARKLATKEQAHYQAALNKLQLQIEQCSDATKLEELEDKKQNLSTSLSTINTNLANIDYRMENQRAGYVYVISNIGAFGEDVYKIGMTRRLEPQDRVDELGNASVPFKFDVHAMIFSNDAPTLENNLHKAFENKKINLVNTRREFFNVTLNEIKREIYRHHDKTVEFTDYPAAQQYRESLKLSNQQNMPEVSYVNM